jgi:glycosyltransferase involved in cell wall biosynthesis
MTPVSIIIPFHNDIQYIPKALASCLLQDVPMEIIVINDGSTIYPINDYYMNIINTIATKYIVNEKNLGLAASRNIGIENANYDFILPLDCDDYLYHNVLGYMINSMEDNDVVFGNLTANNDGVIYRSPGWNGVTKEGLLKDNQVWCTSLFRKSMVEKVGGYKVYSHSHYEDYGLICRLFKAGAKFKYIDEVIYRHTERPDSMLGELHKNTDYYKKLAQKELE